MGTSTNRNTHNHMMNHNIFPESVIRRGSRRGENENQISKQYKQSIIIALTLKMSLWAVIIRSIPVIGQAFIM